MRLVFFLIGLVVFSFPVSAVAGPVASGTVRVNSGPYDNGSFVYLENDWYRLEFDPARGGRARHFLIKDGHRQLIGAERHRGFFLDHWGKYAWPSGLFEQPYECEILGDGGAKKSIRLWRIDDGKGSTEGFAGAYNDPSLRGLKVQKTITLYADRRYIDIESAVINPTAESRCAGLYVQHAYEMDGNPAWDAYYFPSPRGIDTFRVGPPKGSPRGRNSIYDPVAGWIGVRDEQTDHGLVFLLDYNSLNKMYTCGNTAEWWYDNVMLAPGGQWTTQYRIIPVDGFKGFVHASARLLANIDRDKTATKLTFQLAGVTSPLGRVALKIRIEDLTSKSVVQTGDLSLTDVGWAPRAAVLMLSKPQTQDWVVRVTAAGSDWQEAYEYYLQRPSSYSDKQAEMGMAALGGEGVSPDAYYRPQPPKKITFGKPDFSKIAHTPVGSKKALVFFGLYTDIYRLNEAIASVGLSDIKVSNAPPTGVAYFPATYDELFKYRLVVLSDINAKAITGIGWEMLADYVREGGGLMVLGGPYAYGNGEFTDGSAFRQILPADLAGPFDNRWPGEGKAWPLASAGSHAILKSVTFGERPVVYWVHAVKPKPSGQVILTAGQYPAMIAGEVGRGRIAMFTVTPQGDPQAGQKPYWETEAWQKILQNTMNWLGKKGAP